MFKRRQPRALVAGGGPVGLVAAASLARRDVDVTVIEAGHAPATRSYALALHPRSLELLDELDLLDPIVGRMHRLDEIGYYDESGRRATLPIGGVRPGYDSIGVVPQASLEQVLVDRLEASPSTRLLWSHRLRRLDVDEAGVTADVDKLGKDSTGYGTATTGWVVDKLIRFEPEFVVGADGYSSAVRRSLGGSFDRVGPSRRFVIFELTARGGGEARELAVVLGEQGTSVFWPMGDDRCRWSFEMTSNGPAPDRRGKSRLLVDLGPGTYPHLPPERLPELIAERAPWWTAEVDDVVWSASLTFEERLVDAYGRDTVQLAGDAAHLTGPVGVRSLNAGIEEACDLAARIASSIGGDGGRALDGYGGPHLERWRALSSARRRVVASAEADEWCTTRRDRIAETLPALGADLDVHLGRLGLHLERATDTMAEA